jgi:hypothetical protein
MAATPTIILKLEWLIGTICKPKIIYLYQSDFSAFHSWYESHFDRSKPSPFDSHEIGLTDCGHMTYKGHQIRLDPTGRVRL